jgi:hypothetical protein
MRRKLTGVLIAQVVLSLAVGACSGAESTRPKADRGPAPSTEAVAAEETDTEENVGPPSDVVSQLIQRALQAEGSVSYRMLVRRLGTPQHVDERPIANQYVQGQVDTVRTLVYPGVEALVYDVAREKKSFLVRLSLSSPRYATPEGLRVGLTESRVLEKIGPPTRRNPSDGELIYQETDTPSTSLVVRLKADRVVRIDWEFSFT